MRIVVCLLAVALASPVLAQDARPRLSPECRAEILNLCPPSGDRSAMRQCLMAKRDQISEECRGQLQALRAARRAANGGVNGDMSAPGAMKMPSESDAATPHP